MLNILQLISYTTQFTLLIPDNLYLFFEIINDLINMKIQFLKDWVDDTLDSLFTMKKDKNGEDQNIMKNMGIMLFAIVAILFVAIFTIAFGFFVIYFKM
jgi:hypothetical protein